jgi:alpha-glucosidase (family GH31 glycosyl hydrolase)
MCGDALLIAPIVQAGGEVEIALPPGGWFDLNTRRHFVGRQILRYRAKLDQFPVFGREGRVLPLGRGVQHTGEIDEAAPLEALWVFGKPAAALEAFAQAAIDADGDGAFFVRASSTLDVEIFGNVADVNVVR